MSVRATCWFLLAMNTPSTLIHLLNSWATVIFSVALVFHFSPGLDLNSMTDVVGFEENMDVARRAMKIAPFVEDYQNTFTSIEKVGVAKMWQATEIKTD